MGETKRVYLVGHCGFDAGSLSKAVTDAIDGAHIELINSGRDLDWAMAEADLLLINRQLDGSFETASGVELIRMLAARRGDGSGRPALMLISNYEDAQAEAEAAGAVRGFGKNAVRGAETTAVIRSAFTESPL